MKLIIFMIFFINLLAMGTVIRYNWNKDYCNNVQFEEIVFETMEVQ